MKDAVDTKQMKRVVLAAAFGTVIEWYDFFIYGTMAALIFNKLFFPDTDPYIGTLLAFGTSATGFLARPLGALVCGHYGDRIGRKALLTTTLLIMGVATFCVGLLPTYQTIGIAAPLLLVFLRMVQGFATGGEWGGAALMTVEFAGDRRRGLWGSFITVALLSGLVLASTSFLLFNLMPNAQFMAYGWRIPFLGSAVLVALGLYVRLKIDETPEFAAMKRSGERSARPMLDALRSWRSILVIFCVRMAENFNFYMFSVFSLAYVTGPLGLPRSIILNAVVIGALVECISSVMFGILADRIGSKRVMMFGLAFQIFFAFPFFWLLETRSPVFVIIGVTLALAFGNGAISSVQPDFFSRFFATNVRFSGISLGREGASVIGGGLSPLIATVLFSWAGSTWPVAAGMALLSMLGLIIVAGVGNGMGMRQRLTEDTTPSLNS